MLTLNEASKWASEFLNKNITKNNISYLTQYGVINKNKINGRIYVDKKELKKYYENNLLKKEENWKKELGNDLNWELSFEKLSEKDTTKHVHRLHPYKGKFIPQLVEYFLNNNFSNKNVVLDPFMGSGTTLVQAKEMDMHSIGIDVSNFNCEITKAKLFDYDLNELENKLTFALNKTIEFSKITFDDCYETKLKERISAFNKKHFPTPDFKKKVKNKEIDEKEYSKKKLNLFYQENSDILNNNEKCTTNNAFPKNEINKFISKWYTERIKQELLYYLKIIEKEKDENIKTLMKIILSKTARSCRATTHSDIATLKEPQLYPYYCKKHYKICTPVNTIITHLKQNTNDAINRIEEYNQLKKNVEHCVIYGDSRELNLLDELYWKNKQLYELVQKEGIDGVFTSPPYVGQIDYHEQHSYAYELFNIERKDKMEIGPLYKGKGKSAREEYIKGISKVLENLKGYIKNNGDIFIVANDKHDLYPTIAELSGLKIIKKHKRPVLNRTEKDKQPYAETIFHMKKDI